MKVRISEKGRVTIPKPLRDSLGLQAGQQLEFEENNGKLVANRVTATDPLERFIGSTDLDGFTTDQLLAEMRGTSRLQL